MTGDGTCPGVGAVCTWAISVGAYVAVGGTGVAVEVGARVAVAVTVADDAPVTGCLAAEEEDAACDLVLSSAAAVAVSAFAPVSSVARVGAVAGAGGSGADEDAADDDEALAALGA